jgi:dethiobiotin synthetase
MATIFVTGTDTGVGKTLVACGLLRFLRTEGHSAAGFKPVAAGARSTQQGLRNEDAEALLAESTPGLGYAEVNPYCLEPPIAPHLAARAAGLVIDTAVLDAAHEQLARRHDWVVVEGAGGWAVPLNERESCADWVGARDWPVLLVVGMRLGCLNHALLAAQAIGGQLAGWVANVLPPAMPELEGNLESLRARLPAPLLAVVPAGADAGRAAASLSLGKAALYLPGRRQVK